MAADGPLTLLTGASGFVGRHILRELARRQRRVRLIARDGSINKISSFPVIESMVTTADLFSESVGWHADVCRDVDIVIHAAWYAEPGQYLQSPKNRECLDGTLRLAEGAAKAHVRRFVGIGTCFEYDLSAGLLSVETPLKPSTLYAQAKVAVFKTLSEKLPEQNIEFAWCRLFYLYGDGEDSRRLVPYLRGRLSAGEPAELSSGTQIRDYMDIAEVARLVVNAALGPVQGPANICSGKGVTVRQLAETIADEYGRRDLLRFGVRPDNLTDPPCVVGVPTAN
jgi:nucleoside-diphosphate-sugar epimerase